jgi:sugar-phosphatase
MQAPALLSDLDGVLVDSTGSVERAWRRWAEANGIVTSGDDRLARARLSAAGLAPPPVFVTSDQVERGKPDPEAYLLGASRLGRDPSDCVVIEDAPAGIAAGKAAGMRVVALLTTHAAGDLLAADDVVADLRGLPDVLAR